MRNPSAGGRGRIPFQRLGLAGSLALVVVLAGAGCHGHGKPGLPYGSDPRGKGADFSGQVTDSQGQPVAGATVEVNGEETLSQGDGSFRLSVPAVERYILNVSHLDFAELSYISRTPLAGQRWILIRAQVETVDPKGPITLTDRRPELAAKNIRGATFSLPAGALVDQDGKAPAGPVRAAIATLDVANGEGPGDWAVRSDDGQDGRLPGLLRRGLRPVHRCHGEGELPVAQRQHGQGLAPRSSLNMSNFAPNTPLARFWYYDTRDGYWKHNGSAAFDAASGAYTGTVNHLSTINTDIAKFGDAACLKITLDPSVATGLKMRIRYHSGGTPFGQTPTFVMNDTDNAAWRLPANTNVLLELLDAGNAVFGNLIVEDPAGTPTVNNVVSTGPPIPAGHTLWPRTAVHRLPPGPPPPGAPPGRAADQRAAGRRGAAGQSDRRLRHLGADLLPRAPEHADDGGRQRGADQRCSRRSSPTAATCSSPPTRARGPPTPRPPPRRSPSPCPPTARGCPS